MNDQYLLAGVRNPGVHPDYCYLHDFTPATHSAVLVGMRIFLCESCGTVMGGRAFQEAPRPIRFMEADVFLSLRSQLRATDLRARAAERRIDRPTPTEVREYLEAVPQMVDTIATAFRTMRDTVAISAQAFVDAALGLWPAPQEHPLAASKGGQK